MEHKEKKAVGSVRFRAKLSASVAYRVDLDLSGRFRAERD
jgi:hypothetical protein